MARGFEPHIGLCAGGAEPDVGLDLTNHEITTLAEIKN